MLKAIKHIALITLCLLVVGGAAGVRVYVFGCAKSHHEARISLNGDDRCCCRAHVHDETCEHDAEGENNALASVEGTCCTTVSQVLNVSSFAVSQITKLDKIAVVAMLFDACCTCKGECRHALGVSLASSSLVHSPPLPDIYSYGQLRL